MNFRLVSTLAGLVTLPFALSFIFFPETAATMYGINSWTPGTVAVGRLFGVALLFLTMIALTIRDLVDPQMQRRLAIIHCAACIITAIVSAHAVTSGATNALMWSSVALYAFFVMAWGNLIRR